MNKIAAVSTLVHQFRSKSVMLDSDLSRLYQVSTKQLIQAVKRNNGFYG